MINIEKAEENKKSPHLAVTHEAQGFSANNRSVSLLMKSDIELDDETKNILKSLIGEKEVFIEKQSYEGKRKILSDAIKEKFAKKEYSWDYSWAYVEDFDESTVVFSNSDGVSYTSYVIDSNDVVTLGEPQSANRIVSYKDDSGSVVLSESDTIQKSGILDIPTNVRNLIAKSFESISKNEKLKDVFKSKFTEGKKVMDELQKSVDLLKSQVEGLQVELKKAADERDAAQAALAAIEKAQAEARSAQRVEKLKEVVAEDQVEALFKSIEALADDAFETVVKSLKAAKSVAEESDLFKQKSGKGSEEEKDVLKSFTEKYLKGVVASE